MRRTWSRTWRNRLLVGLLVAAACYGAAVLGKWGPQPFPFAVAMAVLLSLLWLVLDLVDDEPASWSPRLPTLSDRTDEATTDLRILANHRQASVPTEAVRDRLVALARVRDPDLADDLRRELGGPSEPPRRLSPADIDRILTRIEAVRDHS